MICRRIKVLDLVFFALSLLIIFFSVIKLKENISGKGEKKLEILAEKNGKKIIYIYPLTENRSIEIQGKLGISIIEIKEGKASFKDSPCPNKTCTAAGKISKSGEWAACLPNRVFIRIKSEKKEEYDGIAS